MTSHLHEGCHTCGTPLCITCDTAELPCPVNTDQFGWVNLCPSCADVTPEEALRALQADHEVEPPEDMNACYRCNGTGGVQVEWNYWSGAVYDPCPDCDGTGIRPVELGGAA